MLDNENNDELLDSLDEETTEVKDILVDTVVTLPETKTKAVAEELGLVSKVEEVKEEENVIKSTPKKSAPVSAIKTNKDGIIGTSEKPVTKKAEKTVIKTEEEKLAVFSTKNVTWNGVGKVYRGYNIVTKDAAEKWLTRDHIRIATPEEIAKEFGK